MLATAMFRIFLIMSIGALAVGKFGGFVVLQLQPEHFQWIWKMNNLHSIFEALEPIVHANQIAFAIGWVLLYVALGIVRCPGQSVLNIFAGYMAGVAIGVPACLSISTATCIFSYVMARSHAQQGNAGLLHMYYSRSLDVLCHNIASNKYRKEIKTIKSKKSDDIDDDKKKENEEDEFKAWSTERFFYMTFARIFPFSHCGFLNIGSGILHYLIPLNEFIGSTVLGNLPYVYALVKYGSIMKTVDVFAPIYRNDYFKIFVVVCIAMLPMAVNRSGILESDWIPRDEFGAELHKQRILEKRREDEAMQKELENVSSE